MKKAGYIAILLFSISFQLSFKSQSYQFRLLSNYLELPPLQAVITGKWWVVHSSFM